MRKRAFLKVVIMISVLALGLAAAGGAMAEEPAKAPRVLILGTGTTGGGYFPMGRALGTLWSLHLNQQMGVQCKAVVSAGSGANLTMVRLKKADLGLMQQLFAKMAWEGTGLYQDAKFTGLRSIATVWPDVEQFIITQRDVKTGTITDVRGTKFSIGLPDSGAEYVGLMILQALGVNRSEMVLVRVGFFESTTAMIDGEVQGVHLPDQVPGAAVLDIFLANGLHPVILEMTDRQIDEVNQNTPYTGFKYVIKAGTYPGQNHTVQTIAQHNVLVCHADLDPELVYQLTKIMYENFMGWGKSLTVDRSWCDPKKGLLGLSAPLHPGAYRYFKEVGVEVPEALIPPELKKK